MLKVVGIGVAGVWKYGVAVDRRIWCPGRLRWTGTEVGGGGGGDTVCGASVFVMKSGWECFVPFKNLFTKVDSVCNGSRGIGSEGKRVGCMLRRRKKMVNCQKLVCGW